jgi:O-antigen/teichoic acid export membrane protein
LKLAELKAKIPVMSYGRVPLIIIVGGRIGVAIAGIVAVRVSTSLLTPDQLGSISQLNSLASLFSLLLVIPVMHFMNRGFLEWYDSGKLRPNALIYLFFLVVVAILSFLLSGLLEWQFNLVKGFGILAVAILISLITLLQSAYNFGVSGLNLFGQRAQFVFFGNLVAWVSIGFSVVLFKWHPNPVYWSAGQVLGFLLGCFSLFFIWKKINTPRVFHIPDPTHALVFSASRIFSFSWPILVTSGLWWMQSQSYRFILDRIQGLSNVGLFTVAYGLAAMPIAMYESIIGQYLDPGFFADLKNKNTEGQVKAWNNYARLYLPGLVLTGIYVAAATPFLAKLILGEAFRLVAIKITLWAAVIETMRATGSLMFHLGIAKADNRMTILPVAAGAILAPTGVYFFGKLDPLYGTIAGLLLASIVVLTIIILFSRKVLPISWPINRVLYVMLLSIPLMAGLWIAHYLYPQPGILVSLLVTVVSGIYTAVILALLLVKKMA